jgi:hypothetical protein
MQVARDKFNDVGEPVLAHGCDHIYGDFIVDVLEVALVGNSAALNAVLVLRPRVHVVVIQLLLVGGLDIIGVQNI